MDRFSRSMDSQKVTNQLFRRGIFQIFDVETINDEKTTVLRNSKILETLESRDFDGLSELIRILNSIDEAHSELAYFIQPVRHSVVWFASSPSHAAAAVHELEGKAGARFSKMQRIGDNHELVTRRARIFPRKLTDDDDGSNNGRQVDLDLEDRITHSHEFEVHLVFPASTVDIERSLENLFKESFVCKADLLLMMFECRVSEPRAGVVMATEVYTEEERGKKICAELTENELTSLKGFLAQRTSDIPPTPTAPSVYFSSSSQNIIPSNSGLAPEDSSAPTVSDSLVFKFYSLCRENQKKTQKSLAVGSIVPHSEEGVLSPESAAALDSSTVLMKVICKLLRTSEMVS